MVETKSKMGRSRSEPILRETTSENIAVQSDSHKNKSLPLQKQNGIDTEHQPISTHSQPELSYHIKGIGNLDDTEKKAVDAHLETDIDLGKVIDSMKHKIIKLHEKQEEITDETIRNKKLGKKVLNMVKAKATESEFSKFELFIYELNTIDAHLLSLTQRLHHYQLALQDLDISDEVDKEKKDGLVAIFEKIKIQHEEACYLRDANDKQHDNVVTFLERYCTEEELADFQYYLDTKPQLALMQSEVREKVKLRGKRLKVFQHSSSGNQSDILSLLPSRERYHGSTFELKSPRMLTYPSEHLNKEEALKGTSSAQQDSANELRQAANRFHQELYQYYPVFRPCITEEVAVSTFICKGAKPVENSFASCEHLKSDIATTPSARKHRSYSENDAVEMHGLRDAVWRSKENSMMSKQNTLTPLLKTTEESKTNALVRTSLLHCRSTTESKRTMDTNESRTTVDAHSPRRTTIDAHSPRLLRNFTEPGSSIVENLLVSKSLTAQEMKSIWTQTDPEHEEDMHNPDIHTSNVQ